MNEPRLKDVAVNLSVTGDGHLVANLSVTGVETLKEASTINDVRVWTEGSRFCFRAYYGVVRYTLGSRQLLVCPIISNYSSGRSVALDPLHLVEALDQAELSSLLLTAASHDIAYWLREGSAWCGVLRALEPERAAALAVAEVRLAPHLSPEAARLYASENPMLAEAGELM